MFQLDAIDRAVIYRRRPTGRLMRPSDHMIAREGLGELGDILDIFKNFGTGVVKSLTAGIYDPSKNRFYVPFSSGQMRNWAQGVTNTATLGLVKTDKFFNSNTMRTVGTIAGVAAAGATAYFGGSYLMKSFGGTPAPGAPGAPGSSVFGPPAPTSSLFSLPSLSTVKTGLEVVGMGAKAIGGGGAPLPQPMGGGQPGVVIINQPSGDLPLGPGAIPGQSYGYGYDPTANYSNLMPPGGGVMYTSGGGGGGGGGGVGPPGSEFGSMDQQQVMDQQGVMQPVEGMSTGMKFALIGGVGLVAYIMFIK